MVIAHCGALPELVNGVFKTPSSNTVGSATYFQCNQGSLQINRNRYDCGRDGLWSARGRCSKLFLLNVLKGLASILH